MQKYHFFYNKASISAAISEEKITPGSENVNKILYDSEFDLTPVVSALLLHQQSCEILFPERLLETFLEAFSAHFRVERAAGGVVRHAEKGFLVIRRFGHYDFPKGHVEAGETLPQTAVREVGEETGLPDAEITGELPQTFHIFDHNGEYVLKQTQWYAMRSAYDGPLQMQSEEQITEARWVTAAELQRLYAGFFPSLQVLMRESGIIREKESDETIF